MPESARRGEDADAVRARVNIVDVARAYTELKKAPHGEWRGLCPVHEERTPSFDVNEEKQTFLCRGCGFGGDVFALVMQVERIDFPSAVNKLGALNGHGYVPPKEVKAKIAKKAKPKDDKPKEYDTRELDERGHDVKFLETEFSVKRCRTDDLGVYWQYPTFDDGMVECRGRQKFLDPNKSGKKYRWIPGDDKPVPCGYPLWKLAGAEDVWLVNGEPSVWLCWQEGVEAVCTLSESSYSRLPELMKLLKEVGTKTLHILLDNDAAGRKGTAKAAAAAHKAKLSVVAYKWLPESAYKVGYDVADLHQAEGRDPDFSVALSVQAVATPADLERWEAGEDAPEEVDEPDPVEDEPISDTPSARPVLVDVNALPQYRKCPDCGQNAVKRAKAEFGGGWWCDRKEDGCGAKFPLDDERIKSQEVRKGRPPSTSRGGTVEAQSEIIKEALEECPLLRTSSGRAYIQIEDKIGPLSIPVEEQQFQDHIVLMAEERGFTLKSDAITSIRNSIGAKARTSGEETEFYLRMGASSEPSLRGRIYLDLCDRKRQVVEVGEDVPEGWRLLSSSPAGVHFWRSQQMGALREPVRVVDEDDRAHLWEKLEDFLQPGSEENFVKMVAWMLQCMRPPIAPYMGMCMTGQANSGKTQRCRMLARIVNSPRTNLRRASEDPRNFHASVNSNFVLGFENLSNIPQWMSDDLCQIATGASIELRKMRTNLELETIECRRPIIVNGITDFMRQSDLKRRFLFVDLQPVSEEKMKDEIELFVEFYQYLPRFLGLMLDCVAMAIRHLHDGDITSLKWGGGDPGFGRWIAAAEFPGGLPWLPGTFRQAYMDNIHGAAMATLNESLLAQALWTWLDEVPMEPDGATILRNNATQLYNRCTHYAMLTMLDIENMRKLLRPKKHLIHDDIEGMTAAQLWEQLEAHHQKDLETKTLRSMEKSSQWPVSPNAFAKWLQKDANQLAVLGIKVKRPNTNDNNKGWIIERRPLEPLPVQMELPEDEEDPFEDGE